jgi:hypothetical protein
MTLLNAPEYNEKRAKTIRAVMISAAALVALLIVFTFAGIFSGHGWAFSNYYAEHRVNQFFDALQAKDYDKAFGIWNNDSDWQQHPDKYSAYPLKRFTEDWTSESPVKAPITTHHVDISKVDGTGTFGTGIIVATRINGDHKIFMYYIRKDGTLEWPAPHELEY